MSKQSEFNIVRECKFDYKIGILSYLRKLALAQKVYIQPFLVLLWQAPDWFTLANAKRCHTSVGGISDRKGLSPVHMKSGSDR